jgi:hypothetical protein
MTPPTVCEQQLPSKVTSHSHFPHLASVPEKSSGIPDHSPCEKDLESKLF